MRVKWTRRALGNLDSAVDYVAADKPTAAADAALKILNRDSERIPRRLSERSRDTEHRCGGVSERTENRYPSLR